MAEGIEHALVEGTRPPMYTAMKYWGKKPHNIWRAYIEAYTKPGDVVLDPFAGSAVAAFEAVKCGRRAAAFDLNPMTAFLIEVYATPFTRARFAEAVDAIVRQMEQDGVYQAYFTATCKHCGCAHAALQHCKWDSGHIYECGVLCPQCGAKYLLDDADALAAQNALAKRANGIALPHWAPPDAFYPSPSFSESFKKNVGGTHFADLWTRRNLYVLSGIFDAILREPDPALQKQLLFGFVQSVHLCSKMCVPRRAGANRAFSTSWGRAAYICSARQMEMNPLLLFRNNCLGKQSVESAFASLQKEFGRPLKIREAQKGQPPALPDGDFDILYGIVDICDLPQYFPDEHAAFVLTDPPYGGLVQYLDLSHVWLVWLKRYNPKFAPNLAAEITVKNGAQSVEQYERRFTAGIKNLRRTLVPGGTAVFTFHNKDLLVWSAFLRALTQAGFAVEGVVHQQNRRTGESNVANPYGTSASDFYIRCKPAPHGAVRAQAETGAPLDAFLRDAAVALLRSRNEPTPWQILADGLLLELAKAGVGAPNGAGAGDESMRAALLRHVPETFTVAPGGGRAGDLWWLQPHANEDNRQPPLAKRVDKTVRRLFKQHRQLGLDDVLAELFKTYPGGLTPDIRNIESYVERFAYKADGVWCWNGK